MHKYIIPLALLLYSSFVSAQFSLGIEAGANMSVVKFTDLDEADPEFLLGFNAGIAPRYSFAEAMSVLADIGYSTKGHKLAYALNNDVSLKNKYTYLTLAPQFAFRFLDFIEVSAGPYLGIKIYEGNKLPDRDWVNTSDLDLISSTDFGVIMAARVFLDRFYLKLAYEHGLQDIGNVDYTDLNGNPIDIKTYTRNFQIGAGYLIGFGS
jgi:hypothetical protein